MAAKRGRPRSDTARCAILDATAELLAEGGMAAVTMEAVAARAGVSKGTVYKWWPTRGAVALDAFMESVQDVLAFPDSGDVETDMVSQVQVLLGLFRDTHAGPFLTALIGQAQTDPEMGEALRDRWLNPRRRIAGDVLRRAIDRGELRPDVDVETLIDQIYAPLYHRMTIRHLPLTDDLPRSLVRTVLDGVRVRPDKGAPDRSAEVLPTQSG
jgi:AcrR family transcriptional regulator